MGAGKTTLKKMVMQSEFYRRYGHGVVAVEADHMKVGFGVRVCVCGIGRAFYGWVVGCGLGGVTAGDRLTKHRTHMHTGDRPGVSAADAPEPPAGLGAGAQLLHAGERPGFAFVVCVNEPHPSKPQSIQIAPSPRSNLTQHTTHQTHHINRFVVCVWAGGRGALPLRAQVPPGHRLRLGM